MEADALATWIPGKKDVRIVSGVEVSPTWKPVGYWFYKDNIDGIPTEAVRVPAERVFLCF